MLINALKFSFRHRYPNKPLLLLQLEDPSPDHEPDTYTIPNLTYCPDPPPSPPTDIDLHLSLNALNRSSKVGTLHFIGKFVGVPLQILVDGGSSDNFLQPCIAKFLQLLIEPTSGFKVLMGNGQSMVAEGKISDLTIEVQRHMLQLPTFLLPFSRGRFDFGFFLVGHSGSPYR